MNLAKSDSLDQRSFTSEMADSVLFEENGPQTLLKFTCLDECQVESSWEIREGVRPWFCRDYSSGFVTDYRK